MKSTMSVFLSVRCVSQHTEVGFCADVHRTSFDLISNIHKALFNVYYSFCGFLDLIFKVELKKSSLNLFDVCYYCQRDGKYGSP